MKSQARENAIVELPKLPDPSYSDCADAIAKFNHFSVCLFVKQNKHIVCSIARPRR